MSVFFKWGVRRQWHSDFRVRPSDLSRRTRVREPDLAGRGGPALDRLLEGLPGGLASQLGRAPAVPYCS